jgi:uncharacterized RDD family membrane protein YckC
MTRVRRWSVALLTAAIGVGIWNVGLDAQTTRTPRRGGALDASIERQEPVERTYSYRSRHRPVLRVWQNYALKAGDIADGIVVVSGDAVIDGTVDGDLAVVFGSARLSSTAVVRGSVTVVAGDVVVADGGTIDRELVLVGGQLDAPPGFSPGREYVLVGTAAMGDRIKTVVPWFTRGLLWGRVIVPGLRWVWAIVAMVLIVSLAINALLHEPVGACADTLRRKPFSALLTGLLVLLLAGPVSILLAATVVGLVVEPFLWCALIVAWIVGKVGVTRWIGRTITGQSGEESRPVALRSFLVGFVAICLLYMVPIIGLMTWALIGVFGLGAASMTVMAAIRRERPAPPPVVIQPPPGGVPPAGGPPVAAGGSPIAPGSMGSPSGAPAGAAAMSFSEVPPIASPPPIASETWPTPAASAAAAGVAYASGPAVGAIGAGDLLVMPRATFLDRTAAAVLDVLLVMLIGAFLDASNRYVGRHDGPLSFLLLFAYFVGFWTWKGTSVGGIICNLRLVRTDGAPLRFADALVRALASFFSFAAVGLGWLWILKDPDHQSWHDKAAGTLVVRVPKGWPLP